MSQTDQIKKHLNRGWKITPVQALEKYGCFRLGARIYDLKQSGMNIETRIIEKNGKRFAEYRRAA